MRPQGVEDRFGAKCPKDHSAAVRARESHACASHDTTNALGSSERRPPRLKCGNAKNAHDDAVVVDCHSREWPGRVEPGRPQSPREDLSSHLPLDDIAAGTADDDQSETSAGEVRYAMWKRKVASRWKTS